MKKWLIVLCITAGQYVVKAQPRFIYKGKIEYERKINMYRLYYSDQTDSWSEQMKKLVPQFKVDYFNLLFTAEKSLYEPGRENPDAKASLNRIPASDNIIFKDLVNQTGVSQKQIFESRFLINDSLRQLDWKLEPDTRSIAGFECHKAVARICDSVVVVAFYADEIVPSGGPESFQGLPGMILELAIPRLYTTWIATKLVLMEAGEDNTIKPPVKGKKTDGKEMISLLDDAVKNWGGNFRDRAIWQSTL